MSKYIIKNCPAYLKDALDFCLAKNATQAICYNCTDCVLKQIVDYCLDNEKYGDGYYTNPILELLDIQEVE